MPGVGDRRGAARLDARVGGLHVRVRADDHGDAAVQPARERDLLARRLGVDVDQDHRRLRPRLLDELVDHLEHRDRRRRKSEPMTLITATLVPSSAAATVNPRPGANLEKFAGRITRSDVSR